MRRLRDELMILTSTADYRATCPIPQSSNGSLCEWKWFRREGANEAMQIGLAKLLFVDFNASRSPSSARNRFPDSSSTDSAIINAASALCRVSL